MPPKSRRKPTPPGISLAPTLPLGPNQVPRCQFVKKTGQQCGKPSIRHHDRCKTHGGALTKQIGPANPNWRGGVSADRKPGRWTEMLAEPLRDAYIRALRDPDILSLESEIALIDVRLDELVKRTGAHAEWSEVKRLVDHAKLAFVKQDKEGFAHAFGELEMLANGQYDNDRAWKAVTELTDRRRILVESERRRLVEQNMFMTREEAAQYGTALLQIVMRRVTDRETLMAIANDWREVMDAGRRVRPTTIDV